MLYIRFHNQPVNNTMLLFRSDEKFPQKNSTYESLNAILTGLESGMTIKNVTTYKNIKEISTVIFNNLQNKLGYKKYIYYFIGLFFITNYQKTTDVYKKIINHIEASENIIKNWAKDIDLSYEKEHEFNKNIDGFLNSSLDKLIITESSELTSLPDIFYLSIFKNKLKKLKIRNQKIKTLPPSLFSLSNLKFLNLSINKLGSLPPEIGNLNSLETLYISSNQLKSLPIEIGKLKSLNKLFLNKNKLSILPPQIGELDSLKRLELRNNNLSSLPPEIGKLHSLNSLILNMNQLESLPPEIQNLNSLETLDLSNNSFKSIPHEIKNLNSLKYLDLSENDLESVPPEIYTHNSLEKLILRGNKNLTFLPNEIFSLPLACKVYLHGCGFSEDYISNLRSLDNPNKIIFITELF
ncbi:MAG: leucine-rich repeat domain-containing protein [Parachlamydiaceae bacterium]|nr:leucine-rich repeat domain-containing protein [Parachlamydiaceae bacterium]